jgi:hypothetical protein
MTDPNPQDVCRCGHTSSVHGFGSGRCFPCDMAAQWMDEECRSFAAARRAGRADDTDTTGRA